MKPQWESLKKGIMEYAKDLQEFVNNVPDPKTMKNAKVLVNDFNRILGAIEGFDKLVEPISPLTIKYPFQSEEFITAWTYYKEYLLEQHQKFLYSRAEQYMLNKLKKWANNKQERAIEILEFYIVNRYPSFFPPNQKQLDGEELPAAEHGISPPIDMNLDKKNRA